MKQILATFAAVAALIIFAACNSPASAAPVIGQPAPGFTLTDANGKEVSLSDFRGRTVVLEWHNPGCPFVQKHYGSGNMKKRRRRRQRMASSG